MWRRKLRWLLAGLAGLGGLFLFHEWSLRPDWRGIADVRSGMTLAEVEAILGCSPGDYGTHKPEPAFPGSVWADKTVTRYEDEGRRFTVLRWTDDGHGFMVVFEDTSGRSMFMGDLHVRRSLDRSEDPSPLDVFRWRIHCLWGRWFP